VTFWEKMSTHYEGVALGHICFSDYFYATLKMKEQMDAVLKKLNASEAGAAPLSEEDRRDIAECLDLAQALRKYRKEGEDFVAEVKAHGERCLENARKKTQEAAEHKRQIEYHRQEEKRCVEAAKNKEMDAKDIETRANEFISLAF